MLDVKRLLELLHTNNDIHVQVKLFSMLSACLISHVDNIDIIVSYNSIYDKICRILSNCPLNKATVMFNFLSALIHSNYEENSPRKTLILYAKNMIRSSGCLATMCELFTSCMMHQDAWRSLCQCLAETCCGVEPNQSYCAHLVPMCIQRCSQRNIDVFLVMQSLLQNHTRNIKLFIECNGVCLFQREFLQHDVCLQLLSTLVQSSTEAVQLIVDTEICQHLYDFLRSYGPNSQLGQWATVILYHIRGTKDFQNNGFEKIDDSSDAQPVDVINKSISAKPTLQYTTDTTQLFENVMKEIKQYTPLSDLRYLQEQRGSLTNIFFNQSTKYKIHKSQQNSALTPNIPKRQINVFRNEDKHQTKNYNLSFLYSEKQNSHKSMNVANKYVPTDNITPNFQKTTPNNILKTATSYGLDNSCIRETLSHNTFQLSDFNPKFSSTPMKDKRNQLNKSKKKRMQNINRNLKFDSVERLKLKRTIKKNKMSSTTTGVQSQIINNVVGKDNKHRSISGWFYEAINESCSAFVQTMKNIFKPKISDDIKEQTTKVILDKNTSLCSYSFTNYMRKRDAILNIECATKPNDAFKDFSVDISNSCNTCNDTLVLKQKLINDENLKQTVRKLKLGINLYGCDFKKISKQLWPHTSYMTPVVLYNLYRKLIIK